MRIQTWLIPLALTASSPPAFAEETRCFNPNLSRELPENFANQGYWLSDIGAKEATDRGSRLICGQGNFLFDGATLQKIPVDAEKCASTKQMMAMIPNAIYCFTWSDDAVAKISRQTAPNWLPHQEPILPAKNCREAFAIYRVELEKIVGNLASVRASVPHFTPAPSGGYESPALQSVDARLQYAAAQKFQNDQWEQEYYAERKRARERTAMHALDDLYENAYPECFQPVPPPFKVGQRVLIRGGYQKQYARILVVGRDGMARIKFEDSTWEEFISMDHLSLAE